MKIKSKLIVMTIGASASLTLIAGVNFYGSYASQKALEKQQAAADHESRIATVDRELISVTLLAMDAIIDREEGDISQERLDELVVSRDNLKANLKVLQDESPDDAHAATLEQLESDFMLMLTSIEVDLRNLLKEYGAHHQENARVFDDMDDKIDDSGANLVEMLGELERKITAMSEADRESQQMPENMTAVSQLEQRASDMLQKVSEFKTQ